MMVYSPCRSGSTGDVIDGSGPFSKEWDEVEPDQDFSLQYGQAESDLAHNWFEANGMAMQTGRQAATAEERYQSSAFSTRSQSVHDTHLPGSQVSIPERARVQY